MGPVFLRAVSAVVLAFGPVASDAVAAPRPIPRLYLGASGGANVVVADWDISETDAAGRPAGADTSAVARLRVGLDVAAWLALEVEAGVVPTQAGGESALVWSVGADVRFPFTRGGVEPYALLGGGMFANPGADHGAAEDAEGHYGLGVDIPLIAALALRVEARHVMSDGLSATLSHAVDLTAGLDLTVWGASGPPPDSDDDGVRDDADRCPHEPGARAHGGCPPPADSDGDGATDAVDRCPDEPGERAHGGCPALADQDGDGIPDRDDRCPYAPGLAADHGCPPPAPREPRGDPPGRLSPLAFDSASDAPSPAAEAALDQIAAALQEHPDVRLAIDGHADARGDSAFNLRLSWRRAERVRDLLVRRGVARERLEVHGYGDTRPRAANDGPAGWAKNRRVEIRLIEK